MSYGKTLKRAWRFRAQARGDSPESRAELEETMLGMPDGSFTEVDHYLYEESIRMQVELELVVAVTVDEWKECDAPTVVKMVGDAVTLAVGRLSQQANAGPEASRRRGAGAPPVRTELGASVTYAAVELRESIAGLFDEAARRSRYFLDYKERDRFHIIRRGTTGTGAPQEFSLCCLCRSRAPDHRCEAAQRSRYVFDYKKRERFQFTRRGTRPDAPQEFSFCCVCHSRAPDHKRCPG